jgi:hypothetical protein
MAWQVHYRRADQQFHADAVDRHSAIAVACILMRDGHEVTKLESMAGDTIEGHELKRLCER